MFISILLVANYVWGATAIHVLIKMINEINILTPQLN